MLYTRNLKQEHNIGNDIEDREVELTVEAEECADGGAHFLLHFEVVVQGHLLHPRHQALIRVH